MSDDPLDQYFSDLRAAAPEPPADVESRLASRLSSSVGALTSAGSSAIPDLAAEVLEELAGTSGAAVSATVGSVSTKVALLMTLGGLGAGALGGAGGVLMYQTSQDPVIESPDVYAEVDASISEPDAGVDGALDSQASGQDASTPDVVQVTEESRESETSVARDPGRRRERMLLRQAQTALARGRPQDAITALNRHRRRFPGTVFAEERDAMAVQALQANGDHDQAAARAQSFVAEYPDSVFVPRVRRALQ